MGSQSRHHWSDLNSKYQLVLECGKSEFVALDGWRPVLQTPMGVVMASPSTASSQKGLPSGGQYVLGGGRPPSWFSALSFLNMALRAHILLG